MALASKLTNESLLSISFGWNEFCGKTSVEQSGIGYPTTKGLELFQESNVDRKALDYICEQGIEDWITKWVPEFWNEIKLNFSKSSDVSELVPNLARSLGGVMLEKEKVMYYLNDLTRKAGKLSIHHQDRVQQSRMSIRARTLISAPPYLKSLLQLFLITLLKNLMSEVCSDAASKCLIFGDDEYCLADDDLEELENIWDKTWNDLYLVMETGSTEQIVPGMPGFEFLLSDWTLDDEHSVLHLPLEAIGSLPSADWKAAGQETCSILLAVGLAPIWNQCSCLLLETFMEGHIHRLAKVHLHRGGALPLLHHWINQVAIPYLSLVTPWRQAGLKEHSVETLDRWRSALEARVHERLGKQLSEELFDLIVEYPDSAPSVADLRQCFALSSGSPLAPLTASFLAAVSSRLLTPGASTADILAHFVGAVRVLSELDPSGLVLAAVSGLVQAYLRKRQDLVQCVVRLLTEDAGAQGGLLEDSGTEALPDGLDSEDEERAGAGDDLSTELDRMERWTPAPLGSSVQPVTAGGQDLVRCLVATVGAKEPIVEEYRARLSDRLLASGGYDVDSEIRSLELLKLRFGEDLLQPCEVMLKDMSESRRVNANVHKAAADVAAASSPDRAPVSPTPFHSPPLRGNASWQTTPGFGTNPPPRIVSTVFRRAGRGRPPIAVPPPVFPLEGLLPGDSPAGGPAQGDALGPARWHDPLRAVPFDSVNATVVSKLFWPNLAEESETFRVPEEVECRLEQFAHHYSALKAPRKLCWMPCLGSVKLELAFENGAETFVVSPVEAAIILLFEARASWPASQLAQKLGLSLAVLRRRIDPWLARGVLEDSSASPDGQVLYTVATHLAPQQASGGRHEALPAPEEVGSEQGGQALVHRSFIIGMLTTFADGLPLERIHNTLKMFVKDPPYDRTAAELQQALNAMVAEDVLEHREGVFRKRAP